VAPRGETTLGYTQSIGHSLQPCNAASPSLDRPNPNLTILGGIVLDPTIHLIALVTLACAARAADFRDLHHRPDPVLLVSAVAAFVLVLLRG
jgi:hypothetical protein